MAINSRSKGRRGEQELAKRLREYGYEARRGQQYNGADGSPDVIGLPGIHIECKRVERLNLEDAMAQSKRDAREGEIPTVMHRKNNCEWLVTMRLEDFMSIYNDCEFLQVQAAQKVKESFTHKNDNVIRKALYKCDYEKNKECPKTSCKYLGKGDCYCTTNKEYAKED